MKKRGIVRGIVFALAAWGLVMLLPACQPRKAKVLSQSDSLRAAQAQLVRRGRGQQGYLAYCGMCHGVWGEGDGPLAAELKKQAGVTPAQLNDAMRLGEMGREQLIQVIKLGGGRTHRSNLMPPWGDRLPQSVIEEIADFVLVLPSLKPGVPRATIERYLEAPPGTPAEGRKLFVFYCTMCHGPFGKGDGLLADSLWVNHGIRPRNLTDSLYFAPKRDQELFTTV